MPLRGAWYTIKQHMPAPAWVRLPEQQRFCGCCSIRTGASVIGWFNFIFNSLYVGMLLLAMTSLTNMLDKLEETKYGFTQPDPDQFSGSLPLPNPNVTAPDTNVIMITPMGESEKVVIRAMREYTLPMIYKSLIIPGIMIIFSILWLITVEANNIFYVRFFGRAFVISIVVQLIMQLGFLIYSDIKTRALFHVGTGWFVWIIFVIYTILNIYFIPIIGEYVKRRMRECAQGMEQGLLTSEMYPRARVAEEYIQDAFNIEADVDMVQFQSSLATQESVEEKVEEPQRPNDDDYSPI